MKLPLVARTSKLAGLCLVLSTTFSCSPPTRSDCPLGTWSAGSGEDYEPVWCVTVFEIKHGPYTYYHFDKDTGQWSTVELVYSFGHIVP